MKTTGFFSRLFQSAAVASPAAAQGAADKATASFLHQQTAAGLSQQQTRGAAGALAASAAGGRAQNQAPAGGGSGDSLRPLASDTAAARQAASAPLKRAAKRQREDKARRKRGMTLIEILIVVGIITSVLGFVMNRVIKRGKKAKVSQAKIMLSSLSQTVDEFSLDCGFYPQTLRDLLEAPSACEEWDGPYVKGDKFLKDPWKNNIHYEYDSDRNDYELISFGADRREGGGGLNRDISSKDL